MNYKYKYQILNKISNKKDIIDAFFDAGFFIKPFYAVDPVSGDCSCGDDDCTSQGKHPVISNNGGFFDKSSYYAFVEKNPLHCGVGVATGYSKRHSRSLVVIDIDDMSHMDRMLEVIPSIQKTFSVKTRRGMHFYFWCDAHNPETGIPVWVNTKKKIDGMSVDILAQGHAGVVAPGNPNKWVLQANEIQTLSLSDVAILNSFSAEKKVYDNKTNTLVKPIVKDFYAGVIDNGQVNDSVVAISSKQLWDNKNSFLSGFYTCQNHIDWVECQVAAYIHVPVNMKKIKRTARDMFNRFTPATPHKKAHGDASKTMVANSDATSLNVLQSLLSSRYQVAPLLPNTNMCYSPVSLDDILKDIREQLVIAGVKMHFKVQDLRAMLQQYHPAMEEMRVRTRMPDGKQKNIRRWNMIIVGSSTPVPNTNMCYSSVSHIDLLNSLPQDNQGTGEHNCATPNKYVSIFTQDNTITISTVEQEPKTMTKTELMAQRLMSIYNTKSIQQEPITSTALPPVEYVQEAKVEDVKVCVPEKQSTVEAPAALSAYNKTMALLESLRIPPPAYTDKVERAFAEAGFF
jgi:hypothetical protein